MGNLIDTCVLRELHLPRPFWRVRRAVDDLWIEDVHLSIVSLGIMEAGVLHLPQEFKQRRVRSWMRDVRRKLGNNLHGIDYETAIIWGQIMTSAARRRLKLPYHDSLMAATAKRHGLVVMTRNVGCFTPFNIEVFNPWGDPKESKYDFGEEPEDKSIQPGSTSADLSIDMASDSDESETEAPDEMAAAMESAPNGQGDIDAMFGGDEASEASAQEAEETAEAAA
jgi:toxin FitB